MQYLPLTLVNTDPIMDPACQEFKLMEHIEDIEKRERYGGCEKEIPKKSLVQFGQDSRPKLLVCITLYNEPLSQLIESIAGVYRAYFELSKLTSDNGFIFTLTTLHLGII